MNETQQLVDSRDEQYADAWAKTGVVLEVVSSELNHLLQTWPRMYLPYVTIVCKLMRIFGSPDNPDHWKDIAGYATLVANDLEKNDEHTTT